MFKIAKCVYASGMIVAVVLTTVACTSEPIGSSLFTGLKQYTRSNPPPLVQVHTQFRSGETQECHGVFVGPRELGLRVVLTHKSCWSQDADTTIEYKGNHYDALRLCASKSLNAAMFLLSERRGAHKHTAEECSDITEEAPVDILATDIVNSEHKILMYGFDEDSKVAFSTLLGDRSGNRYLERVNIDDMEDLRKGQYKKGAPIFLAKFDADLTIVGLYAIMDEFKIKDDDLGVSTDIYNWIYTVGREHVIHDAIRSQRNLSSLNEDQCNL